ncbi:MAG: hypothetical protein WD468_08955 [Pirellulales bacterium]
MADFQAGVLYISKESNMLPDGKDEGVGVKAFTVDSNGVRTFSNNLAKIEESREVSGGTDTNKTPHNGPPHVDESVIFDYQLPVLGDSIEVLLSKFEATHKIDLQIERVGMSDLNFSFIGPPAAGIFEQIGVANDHLWKLKFAGLTGLGASDIVKSFTIRALDDNPADPRPTAEHFLITGMTLEVVPEPGACLLVAVGLVIYGLSRRRS